MYTLPCIRTFILSCFILLASKASLGQQVNAATLLQEQPAPRFLENKGQVVDQDGNPRPDVRYMYDNRGLKVILKDNSFSYELYTIEKKPKISEASGLPVNEHPPGKHAEQEPVTIKTSRVDIALKGANPNPEIIAEGRSEDHVNYYKEYTSEEGITDIHYYDKVTYRNIYDDIDFEFMTGKDGSVKYNIVVRPGGKLSDVQLCYTGMQALAARGGELEIKTTLGNMEETIPYSFLEESNTPVNILYRTEGNIVSFRGTYENGKTLVVDPVIRMWGTYYGGDGTTTVETDGGRGVAVDGSGNVYMAGLTQSTSYVATWGAHQATFGGGWSSGYADAFLVKFNSSGTRQWATYYGGDGIDEAFSVAVDGSGNVFMAGETWSGDGIASSGAYQGSFAGGAYDAFLVKFNSSGTRQWGTYYGGSGWDNGRSVAVDGSGNVYMSGFTNGTSGIASSGAYQDTIGGAYDAFLVKFSSGGSRQWGTYFGGNGNEFNYSIAIDGSANIFLAGRTKSSSGVASSGAYQDSLGGNEDAFLTKFDSSGSRQWATYYGGSSNDNCLSVALDNSGNVYIAGSTSSSSGIATSGAHQTSYAGGVDAFLVKFSSSGSRQWGTYYGGSSSDGGSAVTIDSAANVFIGGTTYSSSGIASSDAYQASNRGTYDVYLAKFGSSGSRQWGTYYGGSYSDACNAAAVDGSGNVYMTGYTGSSFGIASSGAHKTSYGEDDDAFLVKFSYDSADAGILFVDSLSSVYCGAQTRNIYVRIKNNAAKMKLDSVYVGWSVNDTIQTPVKYSGGLDAGSVSDPFKIGSYNFKEGITTISTWTYKPNGMTDWNPSNDTAKATTTVNEMPVPSFTASNTTCQGINVSFTNSSTIPSGAISSYLWEFGDGDTSTSANPEHSYSKAGSFEVKLVAVADNGCKDSVSKTITVYPQATVNFSAPDACLNENGFTNLTTVSSGSIASYLWKFGDGNTSTDVYPSHTYSTAGSYTVWLFATTDKGCTDSISKTITVHPRPTVDFTASDACANENINFMNASTVSSGSIISYLWRFGDNTTSTSASPGKTYAAAGSYTVWLVATTDKGCKDSVSKTVTIHSRATVSFTAPDGCAGESMSFTNSSTVSSGSIASYLWIFGDSTISTSVSPDKTFSTAGTYTVWLVATTDNGCVDSASQIISIYPQPDASYSYVVSGRTVQFSANDTSAGTSYHWDFGDGNTDSVRSPQHTYLKDSLYPVSLQVINSNGCEAGYTDTVLIYTVSVQQMALPELKLRVYPNPVLDNLTIECTGAYCDQRIDLLVMDVLGRKIKETTFTGSSTFTLDMSDIKPGTYFIQAKGDKVFHVEQVIKR